MEKIQQSHCLVPPILFQIPNPRSAVAQEQLSPRLIDALALQRELRELGAAPNPCADQHESLHGFWRAVELIPMLRYNWDTGKREWRLTLGQSRNVLRDAAKPEVFVHQSTIDRFIGRSDYRPLNLPHTESELKAKFKIEP